MKGFFFLMFGVDDMLKCCKDKGLWLVIVIGGSWLLVMCIMECYGYEDIIECVVVVEDVECSKLVLDCYLKVLNEMGLLVFEVMVVEDIEYGFKVVVVVGVCCVVILIG